MSYSIIGAGAIGSAIATQFARAKIDVSIANSRGPASLAELTGKLGSHVKAAEVADAVKADVVFLALPFGAVAEALREAGPWNGRVLVDATNAIEFPSFKPKDLGGRLSTEVIADAAPGVRVVKAFNTLPAAVLARDPAEGGGQRVLFVSGNDATATEAVGALAKDLGFASIALGRLDEGGRLQQFGGALVVHNLIKLG